MWGKDRTRPHSLANWSSQYLDFHHRSVSGAHAPIGSLIPAGVRPAVGVRCQGEVAMFSPMDSSPWPRGVRTALAGAAFLIATSGVALAAPSPSSGTLSPSTTNVTWSGGLIAGGANANESTCNENVTCETYTLTL